MGDNAVNGATRVKRDVLRFCPDLTVVCFGLNDSCKGMEHIEDYKQSLRSIFQQLKEHGSEVIYMTSNMMNTYVSHYICEPEIVKIAEETKKIQQEGILEQYLIAGKNIAKECDVAVCDVYEKWKILYQKGVDTTEMLANYINHPSREMNWLFAYSLVETMILQ